MTTVIEQIHHPRYSLYNGDCVEVMASLPDNSIDFSVYSPPFANLYTYSDSDRDMGNCESDEEFIRHYEFLISEKLRVTKSGRNSAVHCSQLPSFKNKDGFVGWKDFRGDIIRAHQRAGWIYHCEVVIWKCPVVQMTRTKSIRLLYKQLLSDSSMSGMGMPDYLIIFRKPGENESPITKDRDEFPVEKWQDYASPIWPVWFDVNQTRVLKSYKDEKDERHICPLQLDVIERAIEMWSNKGDVVLSPFGGIGSEPHCALKMGRNAVAIELKPQYFQTMVENCAAAIESEEDLFSEVQFG